MASDGRAAAGDGGADVGLGVLGDFGGAWSAPRSFSDEAVASAELHLFGEDAQGGFAGDEVDVGDAGVGVEGAEHLGGEDGAAGAGDGQGEAEIGDGGGGLGYGGHESDYRPSGGSQSANNNDMALPEQENSEEWSG